MTSSSCRRGKRSASEPPTGLRTTNGTTPANAMSPTWAALCVRSATTQPSAASCIWLPLLETTAAHQSTRKSREAKARTACGYTQEIVRSPSD